MHSSNTVKDLWPNVLDKHVPLSWNKLLGYLDNEKRDVSSLQTNSCRWQHLAKLNNQNKQAPSSTLKEHDFEVLRFQTKNLQGQAKSTEYCKLLSPMLANLLCV